MTKKYRAMIAEIKEAYPTTNFDLVKKENSIQLLCDNRKIFDGDSYLDTICDIAIKYLDSDEQNIFAILYDYNNEINIASDVDDEREYINKNKYEKYNYKGLNTFDASWDMGDIAA